MAERLAEDRIVTFGVEVIGRVSELGGAEDVFWLLHIHFSDIAFANRNETKHLPYGQGTLRAEPLREALERFDRPATVISESPDEASHQALRAIFSVRAPGAARGIDRSPGAGTYPLGPKAARLKCAPQGDEEDGLVRCPERPRVSYPYLHRRFRCTTGTRVATVG